MKQLWHAILATILATCCSMSAVHYIQSGWYYCAAFNAIVTAVCLIDYAKAE